MTKEIENLIKALDCIYEELEGESLFGCDLCDFKSKSLDETIKHVLKELKLE